MTPEQLANKLERAKPLIREALADMELFAANQMLGKMQHRIFGQGGATNGKIGKYKSLITKNRSKTLKALGSGKGGKKRRTAIGERTNLSPYERKRIKAGRQIGYKDLEFNGDFKLAFKVGKRNGKFVFGIVGDKNKLIAQGQEEQNKKLIFVPTINEKAEVNAEAIEFLREKSGDIFRRLFPIK
jgi:hypothetical protein